MADTTTLPAPLDQLAKEINKRLELADKYDTKANDHRIAAGQQLKEARARPEMQERGAWGRWIAENIKRSRADVYRCLALVKSDDPTEQQAAREAEKDAARESMSRSREAIVSNVGDSSAPTSAEEYTARYTEAVAEHNAAVLTKLGRSPQTDQVPPEPGAPQIEPEPTAEERAEIARTVEWYMSAGPPAREVFMDALAMANDARLKRAAVKLKWQRDWLLQHFGVTVKWPKMSVSIAGRTNDDWCITTFNGEEPIVSAAANAEPSSRVERMKQDARDCTPAEFTEFKTWFHSYTGAAQPDDESSEPVSPTTALDPALWSQGAAELRQPAAQAD